MRHGSHSEKTSRIPPIYVIFIIHQPQQLPLVEGGAGMGNAQGNHIAYVPGLFLRKT